MFDLIYIWLISNYIETTAASIAILSIYFGIKEKPIFWILALINAVFFVYVFYDKKIYALMVLQFYYISLSFYGFYYWVKGGKKDGKQKKVPIIRLSKKQIIVFFLVFFVVYFFIANILKNLTDSEIPYIDAFMTTFSIVASFLMTKKYIEHWFIWLISDIVAIITFASQGMYPTMVLYFVFLSSVFIGFFKWRNEYNKQTKIKLT